MIAILLICLLSINGGLFTGTVLYTAYKANRVEQALEMTDRIWTGPPGNRPLVG